MSDDRTFIQAIYNTALSQSDLPDLLQELSDRVGAFGAMVFDCTEHKGTRSVGLLHSSSVYDVASVHGYVEKFNADEIADQDRLADLSSSSNGINLIHDARLYSDTVPPSAKVEAMRQFGIGARFGSLLSKENWNSDRFAFQYSCNSPLPSPEKIIWAETMLSHLAKSLSMGRMINQSKSVGLALEGFLDSLGLGVAILSPSNTIIYANTEMNRILQDRSEIRQTATGQLKFETNQETARLYSLLENDTEHGRFGARPRREAVSLPANIKTKLESMFVEICPLDCHPELDRFGAGTRLVTILDGARRQKINAEAVASYFPLSKTEILLLDLVADGFSNSEIAKQRNRSIETVNSQLKSVLRKTSSRNRTELVKVALSLSSMPSYPQSVS